ncbi:MAG: DUF2666 family protein [Candidatus Micrarchaeaceae archaeon]
MDDEPSEYVDFMVKYKDWVAIKRLGIRDQTRPEEIAFHLAGIRNSIDGRVFRLLGIDTEKLDSLASSIAQGKKGNYSALGDALKELDKKEIKAQVESSCNDSKLSKIAGIYVLNKVMLDMGFDSSINQGMLSKIYPDLKVKIPLGAKKKKA